MKVILLGTAWPFRGGLASFNERLIQEFLQQGHEASIITFTTQYPGLLFPGKTQYSASQAPAKIHIERKVSSINPFSWWRTGKQIAMASPDILIIKYWMPFMAPCFGTVARLAKKSPQTKIICIADNIIPHERKFYDIPLTRFFIRQVDAFVVMSSSVLKDLVQFDRTTIRATNPHPLFDNFGQKIARDAAASFLHLDPQKRYLLFFGFIRDYKGLDLLLEAFAMTANNNLELIIAGEFYTDQKPYDALIKKLDIENRLHRYHHFIADEEVKYYFSVADMVAQPYKHATQSGVTQIAYHFDVPMLVTNVGGLAEMVPDQQVGYVVPPVASDIAKAINDFYANQREAVFIKNIQEEKKRFGWDRMINTLVQLRNKLS